MKSMERPTLNKRERRKKKKKRKKERKGNTMTITIHVARAGVCVKFSSSHLFALISKVSFAFLLSLHLLFLIPSQPSLSFQSRLLSPLLPPSISLSLSPLPPLTSNPAPYPTQVPKWHFLPWDSEDSDHNTPSAADLRYLPYSNHRARRRSGCLQLHRRHYQHHRHYYCHHYQRQRLPIEKLVEWDRRHLGVE